MKIYEHNWQRRYAIDNISVQELKNLHELLSLALHHRGRMLSPWEKGVMTDLQELLTQAGGPGVPPGDGLDWLQAAPSAEDEEHDLTREEVVHSMRLDRLLKAARFAITNPIDRSGWDHLEDALEPWGNGKQLSDAEQAELARARDIVSKMVIPPADDAQAKPQEEAPADGDKGTIPGEGAYILVGRSPDWIMLEDAARALYALEGRSIEQWLKLSEGTRMRYRRQAAVCLGTFRAFDSQLPSGLSCPVALNRCDNPDCRILGCRRRAEARKSPAA